MRSSFPDPENASSEGIVAVGGDFSVPLLLDAYQHGIFPWPVAEFDEIPWFSPDPRGVLFLKKFKISKSLRQFRSREKVTIRMNTDFESVIRLCANHPFRSENTWISNEMIKGYVNFHKAGYAHSVEVFSPGGELGGGLYGVSIGRMFAGESMFYLFSNYSKLALAYLVDYLKGRHIEWIDVQVLNPFFAGMGAEEIPRKDYLDLLKESLKSRDSLF